MLRNLHEMTGYTLQASDGEIGQCKDFLFDDEHWTVRWMVADTHKWLPLGRKVLVSPISIQAPFAENKVIPVNLSQQQIKNSPELHEHMPVSRAEEERLTKHLGYGYYWVGPGLWGAYPYPASLAEEGLETPAEGIGSTEERLRSCSEVKGYTVRAMDGDIGHVQEFLMSGEDWSIPFVVVDTRNWLPGGKKVVISKESFDKVSWDNKRVHVALTIREIEDSPLYSKESLDDPEYEKAIREYYEFQNHWRASQQRKRA